MSPEERYHAKICELIRIFTDWQRMGQIAVIQFNFPQSVVLAATISDAVQMHFVTADGPGLELLKQFGMGKPDEPSVLQVRMVIDGFPKAPCVPFRPHRADPDAGHHN